MCITQICVYTNVTVVFYIIIITNYMHTSMHINIPKPGPRVIIEIICLSSAIINNNNEDKATKCRMPNLTKLSPNTA